jgi:hypothetical protein
MVKKPPQESADDKLLGKVIAEELRQQLGTADSDCPETEIVAAFYDRSLSDAERQMWEKHFLKCLRCQEYLAELARLADADEPLPILGDESEAQEEPPAGWFHRLAWVLPVMVIALASAYWYREDIHRYLDRGEAVALKSQEPALPVLESRPDAAAKIEPERAKGGTDLAKAPAERLARQAKKEAIRNAPSAPEAAPGAGTGGGMAAPTARREVADAAKSAESMPRRDEETGSRRAEMPPAPAAAGMAPRTVGEPVAGMGEAKASGFGALTVSGAQQKTVATWRVGRRGTIQKADGEGGWTRVASGVEDDLFDITFAGSTGWVVGHAGLVLRSTDGGKTWQRVSSPTSEDLVRVSSLGADQASVFTRSGKTYTTSDGGQSWK